jgi:hypothetical protein
MEIPVYRRRQTIPGTTGGVNISPEKVKEPYLAEAQGYMAQAQQGQAISQMGFNMANQITQYQAAEKRAERVVEAQKLENTLKEAVLNAKTEIDTNGDYKQYETLADSRLAEIKAQHVDTISDPIVKRAAESVFLGQAGDLKRHAKVQKIKMLTEESTNLYAVEYSRAVDAYAKETDPDKKAVIKDTLMMKGFELESARTLKPGYTERSMVKFEDDTARLTEAYKKDAEAQIKESERKAKEALKLKREEIGNDFSSRLGKDLKEADIEKSNLEPTGENSKMYWKNQLKELRKEADKAGAEGFKTDKTLDAQLYTQIVNNPESITERQITEYIGKGLSRTSADSLITERKQRLNPQKDPARTAAESAIVENFRRDRKAGIFGEEQAGDIEYAKQVDSFRRWSKAHPEDDPSEYYEKVMEPVKESFLFGLLSREVQSPKVKREEMEKAGEIPQRRATDKKQPGNTTGSFDEANLKNQEQWIVNNETKITAKLKGKPAGTYKFPGSDIPVKWDGKGGFTISTKVKR